MRESRELTCGLTYLDIVGCAGMNQRQAAKRLGVSHEHFNRVCRSTGIGHWFPHTKRRLACVSREQIAEIARDGYTRKDAAYLLGISTSYLNDLIYRWSLQAEFVVSGPRAAMVNLRGYCV